MDKNILEHKKLRAIWYGMLARCNNSKSHNYERYGAKGITVCKEWAESLDSFIDWSMAAGYKYEPVNGINLWSIDRIDAKGNYEPSNCRWASRHTQAANRGVRKTKKKRNGLEKFAGVSFVKTSETSGSYKPTITIDYETKRLGSFNTLQEAVRARNMYIVSNDLVDDYPVQSVDIDTDELHEELIKFTPFIPQESRYVKVDNNARLTPIYQFDMSGTLIKRYDSISIAAKETGCPQAHISSCSSGSRNQTGGYRWSRTSVPNEIKGSITMYGEIECYVNDKLDKTFKTKKEAALHYGITPSLVSKCIKDDRSTSKGIYFCPKN